MLLNVDILSGLGLVALALAAITYYTTSRDDALVCLAICMSLWLGVDVLLGSWFCLVDMAILTYAVCERFPQDAK